MQGITLFRRLLEDLESCIIYRIETEGPLNTGIYLTYGEPVDLVVWIINTEYFEKHLRKFFTMAIHKQEHIA